MEENGFDEQWIAVNELCDRFSLTCYQSNTVSGFLRRLAFGTFGRFPCVVLKIEGSEGMKPFNPKKCRYLVKQKKRTIKEMQSEPFKGTKGKPE